MNWVISLITLLIGALIAVTIMVPFFMFVVVPYSEWLMNTIEKIISELGD